MSNEDVSALEEELEASRSEAESLREQAADREARASHLEAKLAEAQEELARTTEESSTREHALAEAADRAQGLEEQVRSSAARYRELALRVAPELPEELIAGETVEEIEAAIARARETVAKVRGHLESEAQAGRVPVGAPPRSEPDFSGLTAEEKIQRGLEGRS